MATNNLINTNHSAIRCQQRGIKSEHLELLDLYGMECPCPGGGMRVMFNKKARKKIERECKDKQVLDKLFKLYFIECSGVLVTASHRKKRFH